MGPSMARKRSKKSRPKTSTNLSLTGMAQAYIVGSAMTKAVTGNNLADFITGANDGTFNPGRDGGERISLPELAGITKDSQGKLQFGAPFGQQHFGTSAGRYNYKTAIETNLKNHGAQAVVTAIITPPAFRFARRMASRSGVTRYTNRFFKMAGLPLRV
jgi:hypothetical protein